MNKLMVTRQRPCYSVWVRMMMRRMTATTAQTAPIMIIFYRGGDTEREKGRIVLMTGNMRIEVSPQTKHRLKLCATNSPLALLCLLSSNQRQVLQNSRKHTHTPKNFKYTQTHLK